MKLQVQFRYCSPHRPSVLVWWVSEQEAAPAAAIGILNPSSESPVPALPLHPCCAPTHLGLPPGWPNKALLGYFAPFFCIISAASCFQGVGEPLERRGPCQGGKVGKGWLAGAPVVREQELEHMSTSSFCLGGVRKSTKWLAAWGECWVAGRQAAG